MGEPSISGHVPALADLTGLSSGFEALFQAAPSPFLVVTPPNYTIIAVNDEYLRATMTERAAILGRGLFEVFPDDPNDPSAEGTRYLRASLERAIAGRRTDNMRITFYPIPRPEALGGGFEERWWSPRNAPVLGPNGDVVCIIHHVVDVTARVRAERALIDSEEKFRTVFESIDEGFCIVEMQFDAAGKATDYRFVDVNPAFERQTGIKHAAGRWMREIAPQHEEYWFEIYGRVAMTGAPVRFQSRAEQLGRTYDVHAFRTGDPAARRVAILFDDITVRKQSEDALHRSLAEREALLKELHHRVKNNLQVITSLLEMQTRQIVDRPALSALFEARNRITAIAAIHELLYQSGSLSEVDLAFYARRLVQRVVSLYDEGSRITASVEGDGITIDLARAVPLGLLLNELVANACKHAFPLNTQGSLAVTLTKEDGKVQLRVSDNGVGLPPGLHERPPSTLGLQLVKMLAKQLGATVAFATSAGTSVEILVPVDGPRG